MTNRQYWCGDKRQSSLAYMRGYTAAQQGNPTTSNPFTLANSAVKLFLWHAGWNDYQLDSNHVN